MKIIVVSGFLGAGKTEFIKELSKHTQKKFVILENEFGEENLDGEYLKKEFDATSDVKIWELTQGCICCSVNLDLTHSILTIANTLNPDYLIIEPSGVAKMCNLIEKLHKITYERIELGVPILIVDAFNYKKNKEYVKNSLKYVGLVVLSKSEQLKADEFLEIKEELNISGVAKCPLKHYKEWTESEWENIFLGKSVLKKDEKKLSLRFDIEKKKEESFQQITFKNIHVKNLEYLQLMLLYMMSGRLGEIDRVKGYVKIKEHNFKFDLAGELYTVEGSEEVLENKVVVIGKELNKDELSNIFLEERVS